MENNNKTKKIIFLIFFLTAMGFIVFNIFKDDQFFKKNEKIAEIDREEGSVQDLCFYRSTMTSRDLYDVSWIKINLSLDLLTGEYHNIPAETDSKSGRFDGKVISLNKEDNTKRALAWWNSYAEGENVLEELIFDFNDDYAKVGFGPMKDRGDGTYVYQNNSNLFYQQQMNKIDCLDLKEKLAVEKYIRNNINSISPVTPVLGGSWYVTSLIVNSISNTGEVHYEDGHITAKAMFVYSYFNNREDIVIEKITELK